MITWKSDTEFEIDGTKFIIDIRFGNQRAKSTDEAFTLVKTRRLINLYIGMARLKPTDILEVGMYQGGSIVLFDKIYRPRRLVGIDLTKEPIAPLDKLVKAGSAIRPYYGTSQSDRPRLEEILKKEFPDGIDMIVDDASHLYEHSKATFEICFPFLKPGGHYFLEDWQWSHTRSGQTAAHPWHDKPALTNLLLELVVSTAAPSSIAKLEIFSDVALITKSRAPAAQSLPALAAGPDRLRGKTMPLI